jgi:hypothetical protein
MNQCLSFAAFTSGVYDCMIPSVGLTSHSTQSNGLAPVLAIVSDSLYRDLSPLEAIVGRERLWSSPLKEFKSGF